MASSLPQKTIDNGADELRRRQMSGRITRPWCDLPNADKRKWREHAEAVLNAVAASEMLEALQQSRSFVELCWNEESGEEALDAKHVLDQVDAAIAKATGSA